MIKSSRSRSVVWVLCVASACAWAASEETPKFVPRFESVDARNLLQNASFECGDYLWTSCGKPTGWGGELSGLYGTVESDGAWDGRHCLRIELGPKMTPHTYFDVWPPAHVVQHAPLAANIGWMPVPRGQVVTLSAYLRSSAPGVKARFLLRFAGNALESVQEAASEVVLTEEWKRYSFSQTALGDDVCIAVGPDLTSTPELSANVWIDAVQLEVGPEPTGFEMREAVEVGFSTQRYGNVFESGSPVTLTVFGNNRVTQEASIALKMEWEDYFGAALEPVSMTLRVPASDETSVPWTLPVPGKGHYRARLSWSANGRDHVRPIKFAVIEPYKHDDSPFGLNHPATTVRQSELLSRGGLRWVRNWSVNWDWVEPKQGEISWQACDTQLQYIAGIPMKSLVVFPNPSANWASSAPSSVEKTLWYRMAYAPVEPQGLFDFIGAAVNRYRSTCHYWEFLNEALWVPDFCLPQKGGYTVKDYIELLKGASKAIRANDPEGKVIGGLAIEPEMPLGDEFIAAGGLAYCDILNLHPYGRMIPPEDFIANMERIQGVMDAHGGRKPIWATETSYYAVDDKPWLPWIAPPNHFSAGLLQANERVCADYVVRHAVIMLSHGVEKIFYHEPIEGMVNGGTRDIENPFLAEEGVPKKTYAALSALANFLGPAPRYVCPVVFPAEVMKDHPAPIGYVFQSDATAVAVVWAPGQNLPLDLTTIAPEVAMYDVMGNPAGKKIVLGESPAYLVSTSLPAGELAEKWYHAAGPAATQVNP
ncbi:MAG: hypothetical protein WC655_23450 [Candidatus Hydrogenedentales bacterium]|jgi:hypothetical protein